MDTGLTRIPGTRILYLNGEITEEIAMLMNIQLLTLEAENSQEDISIYINSPGGSLSGGFSIIDTINLIDCDVSTVCVGVAASMGALILMSGEKGKRRILPHAKVILHQPLTRFENSYLQTSDIEILAENARKTRKSVYEHISTCTGQSIKAIQKDCDRDFILDAKEAMKYGVVDRIVNDKST